MRAIGRFFTFFIFAAMLAIILYFQYGTPPFTAIPSQSMVPVFRVGDLVLVEDVDPADVKTGDIIVVHVPEAVRERFGYPPSLIHRVVKVDHTGGHLQFRIKGDHNAGEDPFTVLPKDIMGRAGESYRYLGYPILFLNSKQGFYFIISSLIIYSLFILYDLMKKRDISLRRGVASFLFADVFRRTENIERGQQQILELLKEYGQKLPEGGYKQPEDEDNPVSGHHSDQQAEQAAADEQGPPGGL
ncbi:MAG TPA: signal peptidase I, partial [Bacillales bacterium]|nr:signal peptidase I [Bacillales bacterium]